MALHFVRRGESSLDHRQHRQHRSERGLTTARGAACNAEQAPSGGVDTMPDELATAEEAQTMHQSHSAM